MHRVDWLSPMREPRFAVTKLKCRLPHLPPPHQPSTCREIFVRNQSMPIEVKRMYRSSLRWTAMGCALAGIVPRTPLPDAVHLQHCLHSQTTALDCPPPSPKR